MYYLTAEAAFDSAHFLSDYEGKCANLHGHRWRVVAKVGGKALCESGDKAGMLLDFSDLKRELRGLADLLDHKLIIEKNSLQLATMDAMEAEGFELMELPFRPTAENLAGYLYREMEKLGFPMVSMTVYETPDNCAVYEEEDS
jgi:6-pyruvoyltetrahydropterin/6-carboxytetrahydropterin synthase